MTALAALSLLAWIYLTLSRGLWRGAPFLEESAVEGPPEWPPVLAVVPARNEADVIARSVRSLAAQQYGGRLAVVVVDDDSTDATGEIARGAGAVEVVRATPPPDGWTGKLWAIETGLRHGLAAHPDAAFVWLTDADIEHAPDELRELVALAEARRLDLVSIMVKLACETAWDRLLIPAFVFFFQKLYPFPKVNDPRSHVAAAAGGSMLVRRAALDRIGGIAAIRSELIDDCALARAVKRGGAIWLGLSENTRSLRPYRSFGEIGGMVARTAYCQLGYSPIALVGAVLGMLFLYLVPPLAVFQGTIILGGLAWALMAWNYRPTLRLYGQPRWRTLLLPIAGVLFTLFTLDSALRHWQGRGGAWKARYHLPGSRP